MPKNSKLNQRQILLLTKTILKYDEINKLGESLLSKEKRVAEDELYELLVDGYISGFSGTLFTLEESADINKAEANDSIYRSFDGKDVFDRFREYFDKGDAEGLQRLIESEWHRDNEAGGYDAAKHFQCRKIWTAILDNKTRDTHTILDGTAVDISEKFYSISGDSAFYPGGFETAEENANCRCKLIYEKY